MFDEHCLSSAFPSMLMNVCVYHVQVPGTVLDFGFSDTMKAEMATGLYFCLHGPVKQEHHLKAALMRAIKTL